MMEKKTTNEEIHIGRYANVLMDRWFKRSFGTEGNKRLLDNFCYALRNLPEFEDIPEEFSQEIFTLLFNSAEIATFTTDERNKYKHDMTTHVFITKKVVTKKVVRGTA